MGLRTERSTTGTAIEQDPMCFHVYRVGSIWGDDKVVRADDRKTPRYYLKGTRLVANWELSLHVGGQNGVPVCHVKSPYLGPPVTPTDPGPIRIAFGPARRIVQVHRGTGSRVGTFSFKGFDDKEYRWKQSSRRWGNKMMECLDSQDQVVATFRITLFARSKDGELRIHEPAQPMADLFIATCLALRTPDH